MAAITICSDFGAPQNKVWHCFHCFPIYFPWSDGTGCHDLRFLMLSFKPTFSLSSFIVIKRLLSSSSLSAIRVVSSAHLRLLTFLPEILIPACASSISALLTMPKPLTVWITINCGKFFKRWAYQTTWPVSWETYMQVRNQQLELDMEQQTGSK